MLLHLLYDLFSKQREKFALNIGMGWCETFGAVNVSDLCLHGGGVSEGTEEFIGSEVGEPNSIHATAFSEDKFAGVESENSVADPCSLALDFEKFVTGHTRSVRLWDGMGKFFPLFTSDSPAETVFTFRIPIAGLQLHEN